MGPSSDGLEKSLADGVAGEGFPKKTVAEATV
jgi:hypothetical protein